PAARIPFRQTLQRLAELVADPQRKARDADLGNPVRANVPAHCLDADFLALQVHIEGHSSLTGDGYGDTRAARPAGQPDRVGEVHAANVAPVDVRYDVSGLQPGARARRALERRDHAQLVV